MPNSEKLKPCPFCGGAAEVLDCTVKGETPRGFQIACINARSDSEDYCPTEPFTNVHKSKRRAIAAWNTRAEKE